MRKQVALLIVNVQLGLDEPYWGQRNNPNAEQQIKKLLDKWRADKQLVIHIQHCSVNENSPLHPSKPGNAFKPDTQPQGDEVVFRKKVNSAFIGTHLQAYLCEQGINELVIVGLTIDHCVSTTVRMARNLGFKVHLVADATAMFDRPSVDGSRIISADEIHDVHLSSMHNEFCSVCAAAEVLDSFC